MKQFQKLGKRDDFGLIYRQGRSYGCKLLIMYVLDKDPDQDGRIGVVVSKKVGNSVVRHRVRRLIKECFRLHISEWADADIVVIARREAMGKSFSEIEKALLYLGRKTAVLHDGEERA